jgi:hypothetical protein
MTVSQETWTVFELVNENEKQIYVGATRLPVFRLASELARQPPKAIKHWDLDHATTVRSVEFDLDEADAKVFIKQYVATALPSGWRYLSD